MFRFNLFLTLRDSHGMRKWKYWWGINLLFTMFRFNLFLTLRD
jgi:hypothetical protein